jgi:hypothetical protein
VHLRFPPRSAPVGDWTKAPWFLDPAYAEQLWSMRYETVELRRAHKSLSIVYPEHFCQRYLDVVGRSRPPKSTSDAAVQKYRQQIGLANGLRGLYEPHSFISHILALGVDLAEVLKTKPSRNWLDRFSIANGVSGAEFETQVWANGLRADLDILRVPERTGKNVGIKTPDFAVAWNGSRFGIEAKTLDTGEHDMVRFENFPLIHPNAPDDRSYEIEFAPEFQALAGKPNGRERYRSIFEDVEAALANKVRELEEAGSPLGEHVVPGAGRVAVTERNSQFPGRSASLTYATEASQKKKALPMLPHLKDAAAKFRLWPERAGHIAIAVIDVPIDYNPDVVHGVILEEVRQNEPAYRHTDAVVWRRIAWHIDPEGDLWKAHQYYACFAMRLPWCALPDGQLATLSGLLLASPHRLQAPVRRRDHPDLTPTVRESLRVYTATLEIAPRGPPQHR